MNLFSQEEESMKIMQFSIFRLVSLPLIIFGEVFYLSNFGAYNYFSFRNEIYQSFYSRVGVFAYYLPDIFFFMSGFLFSRKIIRMDEYKEEKDM